MSESAFFYPRAEVCADDLGTPRVEVDARAGRVAVVTLVGEHDLSTKPLLLDALARATQHPHVVVDLSQCTFVSSSVLNPLIALHDGPSSIGLVVPNAHGPVGRTFELARMAAYFPLCSSLEEALAGIDVSRDPSVTDDVHVRMVVYGGDGVWKVIEPGCRRASAREDSREEAEDRGREILRNLGGGELRVCGPDGVVEAVHVVPAPLATRTSRTYRSPRGTYGLG